MNLVPQEFFFSRIELGLVNFFKRISHVSLFVLSLEHFRKLAAAKTGSLRIEFIDRVEGAMVLEFPDPCVDNIFIFVEESSFAEVFVVVIQTESKHVVFVFDFFKVKSLQIDYV